MEGGGNLGAGSSESWSFGEGMAYAKTIMTARRCTGRVAAGRRVIVEWVEEKDREMTDRDRTIDNSPSTPPSVGGTDGAPLTKAPGSGKPPLWGYSAESSTSIL